MKRRVPGSVEVFSEAQVRQRAIARHGRSLVFGQFWFQAGSQAAWKPYGTRWGVSMDATGARGDIGGVEHHEGGSVDGFVMHERHEPALVLGVAVGVGDEEPLAAVACRARVPRRAGAGAEVVLYDATEVDGRLGGPVLHEIAVTVLAAHTPQVARRQLTGIVGGADQHLVAHTATGIRDGPPAEGELATERVGRGRVEHRRQSADIEDHVAPRRNTLTPWNTKHGSSSVAQRTVAPSAPSGNTPTRAPAEGSHRNGNCPDEGSLMYATAASRSNTTGRSQKTASESVMAKSWTIVGRGTGTSLDDSN